MTITTAEPEGERQASAWRRHWAELCLLLIMAAAGGAILLQHQIFGRDIIVDSRGDLTPFGFSGYTDQVNGGNSAFRQSKPLSWTCEIRQGFATPYCGYEIVLDGNGAIRGADLSNLDAIELTFDYSGPPTTLRLHLKNEDPRYSKHADRSTTKINKTEFSIVPGRNRIVLHRQDFSVAEWWLNLHQLAPELGRTQLDDIVAIEFMTGSASPVGDYHFSVRSLRVARSAISPARLYLAILAVIALSMILYGAIRIKRAREEIRERERLDAHARELLAEAKTVAENASKAKSDFLANMSHELRTPLNAVLGYAQLLQRAPLPDKEKNAARVIHRSGSHLLALITDVLDLSKIEAGKMELNPAPCDPRALIDAVQEIVRVPAEQKGLDLQSRSTRAFRTGSPSTRSGCGRFSSISSATRRSSPRQGGSRCSSPRWAATRIAQRCGSKCRIAGPGLRPRSSTASSAPSNRRAKCTGGRAGLVSAWRSAVSSSA